MVRLLCPSGRTGPRGGTSSLVAASLTGALLSSLTVAGDAQADSFSQQNFRFTVEYTLNDVPVNTVIDVQVVGYYNSARQLAAFSCTSASPTAVQASLVCGQGKGGGNNVTSGNLGSATTTPIAIAAFPTSSVCFTTGFIYPGTSERGINTGCSDALPLQG